MDSTILDMIKVVDQAPPEHTHVVVMRVSGGIRMCPQTQSACELMAEILSEYGAKVLPREQFLRDLRKEFSHD